MSAPVTGRMPLRWTVRAELTKLRTVRSTWWTVGLTVVLTLGIAALASFGDGPPDPGAAATLGIEFGQLPLVVLATLAVTAEHTTGSITSSLLAVPDRRRLSVARFIAVAGVLGVVTAVAMLLAVVVSAVLVGASPLGGDGLRAIGTRTTLTALDGLFIVGLATLLRSTAATLIVYVAFGLLLPGVLFAIPSEGVQGLADLLPGTAAGVITGGLDGPYSAAVAWVIVTAWSAASATAGVVAFRRRDV